MSDRDDAEVVKAVRGTLRGRADAVTPGPAPLDEILRDGTPARRSPRPRRPVHAATGAAVALVVIGVVVALVLGGRGDQASTPPIATDGAPTEQPPTEQAPTSDRPADREAPAPDADLVPRTAEQCDAFRPATLPDGAPAGAGVARPDLSGVQYGSGEASVLVQTWAPGLDAGGIESWTVTDFETWGAEQSGPLHLGDEGVAVAWLPLLDASTDCAYVVTLGFGTQEAGVWRNRYLDAEPARRYTATLRAQLAGS